MNKMEVFTNEIIYNIISLNSCEVHEIYFYIFALLLLYIK